MIDPDAPIPYSITEAGRRAMRAYELEDIGRRCPHKWKVDLAVGLVCEICGTEADTRRQSIPSYLSPKERWGK